VLHSQSVPRDCTPNPPSASLREWTQDCTTTNELPAGQIVRVKLNDGRVVDGEIKSVTWTTSGARMQVSFGNETALVYEWQVVQPEKPKK
jgi:hypothetical protein